MRTPIIERAYELAATSTTVNEVRATLRQEGYAQVDAHLSGRSIRAGLKKLMLAPPPPAG